MINKLEEIRLDVEDLLDLAVKDKRIDHAELHNMLKSIEIFEGEIYCAQDRTKE